MEFNKEKFEATCLVFIEAITQYFAKQTKKPSVTGVPYIKEQELVELKDFTGMIGISGSRKGFVYFSAFRLLFENLIEDFVGIKDAEDEDILDMAGEVTNVVCGNLRDQYGSDFMISVPIVFKGKPERLKFPENVHAYVVPINWNNHEANVVIGME